MASPTRTRSLSRPRELPTAERKRVDDDVERGNDTTLFFEDDGTFKYTEMLSDATLETEELLQWRPEDRPSAAELLKNRWLRDICRGKPREPAATSGGGSTEEGK
ncbi:hypothetical protein N658DRAFT_562538 [Parathielavia hyrcaniae]|uniref:Uncharacterized protein n=1 Tax=Parathielavia hyrcaniae TaxID=113614 RepID=A0AAN6PQX5_9PEZI|nr:hypothetical protein N658DRAFT_562538 [Parathielavia hyrcaniae]